MRFLLLLIFLGLLLPGSKVAGQTINLSLHKAPLQTAFKEIERQSGYVFLYDDAYLSHAKLLTVKGERMTLKQALDKCFAGQPLTYEIEDRVIIVRILPSPSKGTGSGKTSVIDMEGKITNRNGEAIAGATVIVQGTRKSNITDESGGFFFKGIMEDAVLFVSCIGYETRLIGVNGTRRLTVMLDVKVNSLDETVIIAYGTITKRFNTGNISSIKSADIGRQPVSNVLAAMIGRMPGIQILQNTGIPGGDYTVQIRGKNSISQGNDPFYIIDGVPFTGATISTGMATIVRGGNPLGNINPADIESIEVLKDADATAIYGSRGANGVILITTKKGKLGKTTFDINAYHGFSQLNRKMTLLNTAQYLEMRKEALQNDGIVLVPSTPNTADLRWDSSRNTNWQKELLGGTGQISDVQMSLSGGSAQTQFRIGAGLHREEAVFPGSFADTKYAGSFSIHHTSLNNRVELLVSGAYLEDKNNLNRTDLTQAALTLPPNAPDPFNTDGTLNWEGSTWSNPYAELIKTYNGSTSNLVTNVNIAYQVTEGFKIRSSFGYTTMRVQEVNTLPLASFDPGLRITSTNSQFNDNQINTWVIEPQAEYTRTFDQLKVQILVGTTFQQNKRQGETITASGYTNDALLKDIKSAANLSVFNSVYSKYRYNAVFGRLNFSWAGKYLVNLTGRRDGSSRFGPSRQFANFGAAGLGWIFSSEKWIAHHLKFLSFGKIRTSYGTTGNDQIKDYGFLDLWIATPLGYMDTKGLYTDNLYNPYFAWEVNRKLEFGLEIGLFNGRVYFSASHYRNTSKNQLVGVPLPLMTGFSSVTANLDAEVRNTGWEFDVTGQLLKRGGLNWSVGINLTIPRSELVQYPAFEKSSSAPLLYAIGYPLNVAKVYPFIGVNEQTGVYEFKSASGNPTSAPALLTDRTMPVSLLPKFYGGLQQQLNFRGWELDLLFQFVRQTGMNYLGGFSTLPGGISNQPNEVMNRWTKSGEQKPVQRFTQNTGSTAYRAYSSSFSSGENKYSDASFVRLKNLSVSYYLPKDLIEKVHMNSARLYLQCQNLFTITSYKGLDPETQSFQTLPTLRVLTAGLKVSF